MSVHMFKQKLYKNGNSVVVTIPKGYMKDLNLRDGSQVIVEKRGDELIVTSQKRQAAANVDVKFMKMVDSFIADHEDVLAELSKR